MPKFKLKTHHVETYVPKVVFTDEERIALEKKKLRELHDAV
jgi:hypothetical protein